MSPLASFETIYRLKDHNVWQGTKASIDCRYNLMLIYFEVQSCRNKIMLSSYCFLVFVTHQLAKRNLKIQFVDLIGGQFLELLKNVECFSSNTAICKMSLIHCTLIACRTPHHSNQSYTLFCSGIL